MPFSQPTGWSVSGATEMAKSLLIVSRQAPWSGLSAREALDLALAGGAFDLPLAMLFLDDGVFQLQLNQQATALQQKDLSANLKAMPMFGIDQLYACSRSLQERGMSESDLCLPVTGLDNHQIRDLFERYDQVVTF